MEDLVFFLPSVCLHRFHEFWYNLKTKHTFFDLLRVTAIELICNIYDKNNNHAYESDVEATRV